MGGISGKVRRLFRAKGELPLYEKGRVPWGQGPGDRTGGKTGVAQGQKKKWFLGSRDSPAVRVLALHVPDLLSIPRTT